MSSSQHLIGNDSDGARSFRQSQELLGAYPFASATPSTHVARHLSNLSLSAAPPSYIQPLLFSSPSAYNHAYSYQNELSHLSSSDVPIGGSERAYWDSSRGEVFRMMADQAMTSSYEGSNVEWNSLSARSSYQLAPFAQSVVQHATPYNSYPTPPPVSTSFSSSSSSLANALGSPTPKKIEVGHQKYAESHNVPNDSIGFFDNFMHNKLKELNEKSQKRDTFLQSSSLITGNMPASPDLSQNKSTSVAPLTNVASTNTPKKRKFVEVLIDTPRKQSLQDMQDDSKSLSSPLNKVISTGAVHEPNTPVRTPRMQVFVEIPPPKIYSTPSRPHVRQAASSPDLGGYGIDDSGEYLRRNQEMLRIRLTGKRTGERDERAPLEKFLNLVDDIFEADDNASPDSDIGSLPSSFFSHLSSDPARPLLHADVIRRLSKAINKVARPAKRIRLASVQWEGSSPGSPRKAAGMCEVDTQTLARLLKILERSVQVGEDLDPFESPSLKKVTTSNGTITRSDPNRKAISQHLPGARDDVQEHDPSSDQVPQPTVQSEIGTAESPVEMKEDDFVELERALEVARDSVLAADCCIALLTSDRLAKQLFSEDLITSCLSVIKNSLAKIIYPFVEAPSVDHRASSPLLMYISGRFIGASSLHDLSVHRRLIGDIFQSLSSAFPRINNLICSDGISMPESVIIPAVYIAIGPFFVVEGVPDADTRAKKDTVAAIILQTLGSSGVRGLRLEALSLVQSIFAYHDDQRSWIIEEILTSLVTLSDSKQKAGMFRLRDGRSIRTVSALLLQLVQTSAHSVRVDALRLAKSRQQQLVLKRRDSSTMINQDEHVIDELDIEEARQYMSGLEAPTKAAKAIVVFLTQRSGKGKSTKNTNELEYRAIFDNLISDLLVVLFWPEWPAAGLILGIVCKYMISALDDIQISSSDNNAFKALALDHLGVIAGRLRGNFLKWNKPLNDSGSGTVSMTPKNMEELVSSMDRPGLEYLVGVHQEVSSHLSKRAAEDHAYESARELNAVIWGQELATALLQLNDTLTSHDDDVQEQGTKGKHLTFAGKIKTALRDVWKDAPTDVFDNTTQEELDRAGALSEQLGASQVLKNAFEPILNVIILALDAPAVFVRTKALRALSHILTVDSTVLSIPNVRLAIESHLLDSSPQVRDAAVELIGKYMIDSPIVAGEYYHKIAERIADTGLGVRKRVIRLLKTFYFVTDNLDWRIDSCSKLVLRMFDEDDTVKDLSVKTIEELWFSQSATPGQVERGTTLATVSVIMGVCDVFKDRQSPLEDMLCRVIKGKAGSEESNSSPIWSRFQEVYDVMLEGLVDATEFVNFTTVNCVRAIHLFTSACPSVMTGSKASVLLPYLKNSASNEDIIISDYILKIYRISIPYMSKTSLKFGQDLQAVLQPMVLKPNIHGTSLQEIVACLCAVVQHLTHESARVVALLKSCLARLRQFVNRSSGQLLPNDSRTLHILVVIVSLLGEHFDFDALRSESRELSGQIDSVSKGPIVEYIYMCLLQLYEKYEDDTIRGRLLICLGCLFRARPTLMTLESSSSVMDEIFATSQDDNRARLLKIIQEFLLSEAAKHSEQQTMNSKSRPVKLVNSVDMEELVGNTRGFAESGVSSAVVQRYLSNIIEAALSPHSHIQNSAVDILSFTIKQGLAHPLLSFPVIVALETSPISALSSRAVALHTTLHHKHSSLLNSGFITACRKSYEYQCKLASTERNSSGVRGFRMQPMPTALLARWYALVREKRVTRQEFLRAVLKAFELRDINATDEDAVHFVRYMAENFASFDYRTQEEVLTVVKTVTRELAETGALLVERFAPGNLLAQLRSNNQVPGGEQTLQGERTNTELPDMSSLAMSEQLSLMRSSCVIGIIMLLKRYLKNVYGLSEEKCQKFVIGKKSAVGDRPAVRRKEDGISWERMPFAMRAIRTAEEVAEQRATVNCTFLLLLESPDWSVRYIVPGDME